MEPKKKHSHYTRIDKHILGAQAICHHNKHIQSKKIKIFPQNNYTLQIRFYQFIFVFSFIMKIHPVGIQLPASVYSEQCYTNCIYSRLKVCIHTFDQWSVFLRRNATLQRIRLVLGRELFLFFWCINYLFFLQAFKQRINYIPRNFRHKESSNFCVNKHKHNIPITILAIQTS